VIHLRASRFIRAFSLLPALAAIVGVAHADPRPASSIPAASLIQPAELASTLRSSKAQKPLILQVGFRTLYDQAHIQGAEYAGAASGKPGLQALRDRVAALPKDAPIVIYCGCCPWSHCPNIAGAFHALRDLEFTKLKVLYIPNDFGVDWVEKGYPVGKGA
jgi:thiosulfate/3-mercaptopyruvate sulfurtransferase